MSLIPPKEAPPQTTLEEKTKGFTFALPKEKPEPAIVEQPAQPVQPIAQTSLLGTATVKKPSPVPELSDEKFVLVADAIPEISEESIERFKKHLTQLQEAVITNDTNNLQSLMKDTLEYLQDNPNLNKYIAVEDRAIFVAACRKSAGITVQAKTKRKTKKTASDADVDGLMNQLADMDLQL